MRFVKFIPRDSHIQDANRPKRTETCMRFGTCSRNMAKLEYILIIDPIRIFMYSRYFL